MTSETTPHRTDHTVASERSIGMASQLIQIMTGSSRIWRQDTAVRAEAFAAKPQPEVSWMSLVAMVGYA
jgi:hypothetical protein